MKVLTSIAKPTCVCVCVCVCVSVRNRHIHTHIDARAPVLRGLLKVNAAVCEKRPETPDF